MVVCVGRCVCVLVKSCAIEVGASDMSLCFMSNASKARNSPVGKVITVEMARADFFEAQTAHSPEPLAQ